MECPQLPATAPPHTGTGWMPERGERVRYYPVPGQAHYALCRVVATSSGTGTLILAIIQGRKRDGGVVFNTRPAAAASLNIAPLMTASVGQVTRDGRWTADEARQFHVLWQEHGNCWRQIAQRLPSRSTVQIRTHAQKVILRLQEQEQEPPPPPPPAPPHHKGPSTNTTTGTRRGHGKEADASHPRRGVFPTSRPPTSFHPPPPPTATACSRAASFALDSCPARDTRWQFPDSAPAGILTLDDYTLAAILLGIRTANPQACRPYQSKNTSNPIRRQHNQ